MGKAALIALAALTLTGCSGGAPEFFRLIKVTETKGSVSVARKNDTMDAYADMNMEAGAIDVMLSFYQMWGVYEDNGINLHFRHRLF